MKEMHMENTVLITGNTYPVKDALRAMGAKWDPSVKGWRVPTDKAEAARKLVTPAVRPAAPSRPAGWYPCGYPGCCPTYCDECDGKGGGRRRY